MKVIDCHCHIYPEKIARVAAQSVGEFYGLPAFSACPTGEDLLRSYEGTPISRAIVHSVATKPSNVESINNFIAEQCRLHPEFIGFATLHPDYPNPEDEIERVMALGLKGIKLHPDMQRVNTDDPRLMRIYEAMEGRLPLMVHCGDSRPQLQFSHPRHLAAVLKAFPALVVDAAHLGGWGVWDVAAPLFEHENCFFDVSSCLAFLDGPQLCAIARRYGTERVMFGSDFPIWDPARELQAVLEAGFTDAELEGILGGNCRRYLGM